MGHRREDVHARGLASYRGGYEDRVAHLSDSYFLIVLGSGGHTMEMLRGLDGSHPAMLRFHRRYVISRGDSMSMAHMRQYELRRIANLPPEMRGTFDWREVPRARKIHQSLWSAPISSLWSLLHIVAVFFSTPPSRAEAGRSPFPHVILTNGPATGFFVALAGYLLRMFYIAPEHTMNIVYIESWARIKSLSLTGSLFYYLGIYDLFSVQHVDLAERYGVACRDTLFARNEDMEDQS